MYNLPLLVLLCNAQALCSETSYCYYCVHCSSAPPSVSVFQLHLGLSVCLSLLLVSVCLSLSACLCLLISVCLSLSALALYCAVLYILLV